MSARILLDITDEHCRGVLIERLPGCEEDAIWERILDTVDQPSTWQQEVADKDLSGLAQHLFADTQLRTLHDYSVGFHCPCSRERYLNTLVGFPDKQLIGLVDDDGQIHCNCDFCHSTYAIPLDEVLGSKLTITLGASEHLCTERKKTCRKTLQHYPTKDLTRGACHFAPRRNNIYY